MDETKTAVDEKLEIPRLESSRRRILVIVALSVLARAVLEFNGAL